MEKFGYLIRFIPWRSVVQIHLLLFSRFHFGYLHNYLLSGKDIYVPTIIAQWKSWLIRSLHLVREA